MSSSPPNGRRRKSSLIRPRPRAGALAGLVLSMVFAVLVTPIILGESVAAPTFEIGAEAPTTVRVPLFGISECVASAGHGSIVAARGQVLDAATVAQAQCVQQAQPTGAPAYLAYMTAMFLIGLLFTSHLRSTHGGRLLRTQVVLFGVVIAAAAAVKVALLMSPVSLLIVPVAGLAALVAVVVDRSAGVATGLLSAVLFSSLAPFDAGVLSILAVQAIATVLILGDGVKTRREAAIASFLGGLAAAIGYLVLHYLSWQDVPIAELETPMNSAWVAAAGAGVISVAVALGGESLLRRLLGSVTKNRLVDLEDLSNPMLKQIASKSPGSWQHSLAMANMAEIAANAIGANGRLVRVGAYYHDLGKSLQPKYFIENLQSGEPSPHDSLDPDVSCDAIFAHVTEGVRLGRKHGLPERIIDFMHMHHGNGLLEYFWAKCQEKGNPKGLTEGDFRYPGVIPDSKETAILAIVDAVEAASRTLKQPEESAIRNLVQRIVYGKLHLGQLDDSGLTAADLRRISDSLFETIKHAHHTRIEYPWQKKEKEAQARLDADTADERPSGKRPKTEESHITSRFAREPRLDSLDVPRPSGSHKARKRRFSEAEIAPTERLESGDGEPPRKPRAVTVEQSPHDEETADMEMVLADAIDDAIDDEDSVAAAAGSGNGNGSAAIALLGDQAESGPVMRARAASQSEALQPGMVVVGPPPATRRKAEDE